MNELEKKYGQMIQTFVLLRKYKKMSHERREELKNIVLEYLNQLNDDKLNKLIKKALRDGKDKPELCDQIICALVSILDELFFGEVVRIITKFDLAPTKFEVFRPQPKYTIPDNN